MKIHFTRSSVCLGDDFFDNSKDFEFNDQATWEDIMPTIIKEKFLPSISGNNVVWVLENVKEWEILSYFTLKDKILKCSTLMTLEEICGTDKTLHFKYYTSPLARKEYILKINNGSRYNIWHDGWDEEYILCEEE